MKYFHNFGTPLPPGYCETNETTQFYHKIRSPIVDVTDINQFVCSKDLLEHIIGDWSAMLEISQLLQRSDGTGIDSDPLFVLIYNSGLEWSVLWENINIVCPNTIDETCSGWPGTGASIGTKTYNWLVFFP